MASKCASMRALVLAALASRAAADCQSAFSTFSAQCIATPSTSTYCQQGPCKTAINGYIQHCRGDTIHGQAVTGLEESVSQVCASIAPLMNDPNSDPCFGALTTQGQVCLGTPSFDTICSPGSCKTAIDNVLQICEGSTNPLLTAGVSGMRTVVSSTCGASSCVSAAPAFLAACGTDIANATSAVVRNKFCSPGSCKMALETFTAQCQGDAAQQTLVRQMEDLRQKTCSIPVACWPFMNLSLPNGCAVSTPPTTAELCGRPCNATVCTIASVCPAVPLERILSLGGGIGASIQACCGVQDPHLNAAQVSGAVPMMGGHGTAGWLALGSVMVAVLTGRAQ